MQPIQTQAQDSVPLNLHFKEPPNYPRTNGTQGEEKRMKGSRPPASPGSSRCPPPASSPGKRREFDPGWSEKPRGQHGTEVKGMPCYPRISSGLSRRPLPSVTPTSATRCSASSWAQVPCQAVLSPVASHPSRATSTRMTTRNSPSASCYTVVSKARGRFQSKAHPTSHTEAAATAAEEQRNNHFNHSHDSFTMTRRPAPRHGMSWDGVEWLEFLHLTSLLRFEGTQQENQRG